MLPRFQSLSELDLTKSTITAKVAHSLARCQNLQNLIIDYTTLDDAKVPDFSSLHWS